MWLMTTYGFYSVVVDGQDKTGSNVLVRARTKTHLTNLGKRFKTLLGKYQITETLNSDYRWRISVDQTVWSEVTRLLSLEIEYDNFKGEVHKKLRNDEGYMDALHQVWGVMFEYQRRCGSENPAEHKPIRKIGRK